MSKKYAVIDRTETVVEAVFKDIVQLVILAFCVWISKDSTWWTFITGFFFMLNLFIWCAHELKIRKRYFRSEDELLDWLETLDWK